MGSPAWPEEDLAYLRKNYDVKGPKQIAVDLNRTPVAVRCMGHSLGLKSAFRLRYESVRHDYFGDVRTHTQAYLLGLLAADGCVGDDFRIQLQLAIKDRILVDLIRDEIAPGVLVTERATQASDQAAFCISSKQIAADLAAYGVTPRKSFTLQWPDRLVRELKGAYICGAFDGDGTLGWVKDSRSGNFYPRWELCSASRAFLESVAASIRRNTGARVAGPSNWSGRTVWVIRANSANAQLVDRWIHADVPGLARKRIPVEMVRQQRRSPRRLADIPPPPGQAKGSRNANSKLTEASVVDIRARHRAGESVRSLASEYGVSRVALRNAIAGRTWRHVAEG